MALQLGNQWKKDLLDFAKPKAEMDFGNFRFTYDVSRNHAR